MKQKLQKPLSKFSPKILIVISVPLVCIGIYTLFFAKAATSATYYLTTAGNDANLCTQSQPCLSFNRALQVAQRGDTVEVAAGSYAPQSLTRVPGGTTGYVTFKPVAGAIVKIGNGSAGNCKGSTSTFWQLCIEGADWVQLQDFSVFNNGNIGAIGVVKTGAGIGSENIILRNMSALAVRMQGRVDNVQILGGDYGGDLTNGTFSHVSYLDTAGEFPSNITFDGVRFHDIQSDTPGDHMECILANAFSNLTLINSRFEMCGQNGQSTGNIHFNNDLGASSGYTIRNNFFGNNGGQPEVVINGDIDGSKFFEFNSIDGQVAITDGFSGGPMTARGNYSSQITCLTGVTYEYNVTTGGACTGTGNVQVGSLNFVNSSPSTWDLHLSSNSNAEAKVLLNCTANDIDGNIRPTTKCDAGADEHTASVVSTTPGDVNGDNSVNISDISALLSAYGQTGTSLPADLDKNSAVNIQDLSIVLQNYGASTLAPTALWAADGSLPLDQEWGAYSDDTNPPNGYTTTGGATFTPWTHPDMQLTSSLGDVLSGLKSYRVFVPPGETRHELKMAHPVKTGFESRQFKEGDETWLSWSLKVTKFTSMTSGRDVINQFRHTNANGFPTGGSPHALNISTASENPAGSPHWRYTDDPSIYSGALDDVDLGLPVVIGQPIMFTFHFKWSADPAVGYVEIFANDGSGWKTVLPKNIQQTLLKSSIDGTAGSSHMRFGSYRVASAGPSAYNSEQEIYMAGLRAASTRTSAEWNLNPH